MIRKTFALLTALLLVASLPLAVFAAEWNLSDGDITISVDESGIQTVSQPANEAQSTPAQDSNPVIKSNGGTKNTITIDTAEDQTANVTIEDVHIQTDKPGIEVGNSSLNLTLKGENTIENTSMENAGNAGIHVSGGSLTITADGGDTLDVEISQSSNGSAAIGSNNNEAMSGSITIEDNATVTGTGSYGAGIGSGYSGEMSGSIAIEDNAQVNANSNAGAGIGSGNGMNGGGGEMSGTITIGGTANVTAKTGPSSFLGNGAGIGSGNMGKMSGTISISTKATVDASSIGAGSYGQTTSESTIQYFDPDPAPTQPEVESAAVYQVVNEDGVSMGYTSAVKDGVLTIAVKGDYARLTGSVAALKTLASWGYSAITLVTDNATSTFALADLQAKGPGTYALTHSGQEVTLTLNGEALAGILK